MKKTSATTLETILTMFFLNYQNPSKQQFTNMCLIAQNYCDCFEGTSKIVSKLKAIYSNPVKYTLNKHSGFFKKEQKKRLNGINKSLANLDWIYWRDSHFPLKLNKPYFTAFKKLREQRKIYLGEVIDILGFLKKEMQELIILVANENDSELKFKLPQIKDDEIKQEGVV